MAGKREIARQRTDAEIMHAARAQLAEVGAAALSLREVARETGMVSSAIYRYVESRDALLTRLIIEAYDALGSAVERATEPHVGQTDLGRWESACSAVRAWAIGNTHEYLLLYGSPVPGYAAPADTVGPGTRATRALAAIVGDAAAAGRLAPVSPRLVLPSPLDGELERLGGEAGIDVGPDHIAAFVVAWTQLFGLVGFEITNQTRGMVESHESLFGVCVRSTGHAIGLRDRSDADRQESPRGNRR